MKNKKGQSMFELIVAIFVVALTLVAILGLVTGAIGGTTFSKEKTQAGKFTQEAVEWLRSERDKNWVEFKAKATGNQICLQSLAWNSSCDPISGSNFRRVATLRFSSGGSGSETVEATVTTSWSDSTGAHESTIVTYFTNWRTR